MAGRVRRREGGRLGTGLFLLGCLAVLGGTFTLGVMAGRHWYGPRRVLGAVAEERPERRREERRPTAPLAPALTFYQELTAPLAAPPLRPAPTPSALVELPPAPRVEAPPAPRPTAGASAPAVAPGERAPGPQRYTVQLGAYTSREPAEALRERLQAEGVDAYVVEGVGPAGVRYRVRVGSFATREAAQEAAARLGRERALPGFVTVR